QSFNATYSRLSWMFMSGVLSGLRTGRQLIERLNAQSRFRSSTGGDRRRLAPARPGASPRAHRRTRLPGIGRVRTLGPESGRASPMRSDWNRGGRHWSSHRPEGMRRTSERECFVVRQFCCSWADSLRTRSEMLEALKTLLDERFGYLSDRN